MNVKKILLAYISEKKFLVFILLLSIIGVVLVTILPPMILQRIVDEGVKETGIILLQLALIYISAYIILQLFEFIKQITLISFSQGIVKKTRILMLNHLHGINYMEYIKNPIGQYEAYFSNDVESINSLITSGAVSIIIDFLKIIAILVSIFLYKIEFGFITLTIIPFIAFFTAFVRKKMAKHEARTKKLEAKTNSEILELIENNETIKAYSAYDYVEGRYTSVITKHFQSNEKVILFHSFFSPIMIILKYLVICSLIILASNKSLSFGVTTGVLVGFIDLIGSLFEPLDSFGMEIQTIQKSFAGIKRIDEFFSIKADFDKNLVLEESKEYKLEFKNIDFSYEHNKVFSNFSLEIKTGEKLVISGDSGAGKSTLFRLAFGLLRPTKGEILINNTPVYQLNDSTRHHLFGILFQDPFFGENTVYEEISMFDRNISREKVIESLKKAELYSLIDKLDFSIKKISLSEGEKILFNLARLIAFDNPIWFFDELNARIDPVTTSKILKIVEALSTDKLIIFISHYGADLPNSRVIRL